MFRILDYVSSLNILKETSTHLTCYCPVCGDDNFKINTIGKHKGAYKCWSSNCNSREIRESLGYKDSSFRMPKIETIKFKPQEVAFNGTSLFTVSDYSPIEPSVRSYIGDYITETREYPYSSTQRVLRIDNVTNKTKYVYIQYLNHDFAWVEGSGPHFWPVYSRGLNLHQDSDTLLFVEGEKAAEFCKERGLAAITVCASNFYSKLSRNLLSLIAEYPNIKNILYVPDHDKAGYSKAKSVQNNCWIVGLGCKILPMTDIVTDVFDGMDLADCTKQQFENFKHYVRRDSAISTRS